MASPLSSRTASSTGDEDQGMDSLNRTYTKDEVFKVQVSSKTSPTELRRTSLWKFDPLLSVDKTAQEEGGNAESEGCNGDLAEDTKIIDKRGDDTEFLDDPSLKNIKNNPGRTPLITFESPKKLAKPLVPKNLFYNPKASFKKYSEDEFQQVLKIKGDRLRDEFLRKLKEYEMSTKEEIKREKELHKLVNVSKAYQVISSELLGALEKKQKNHEEMEIKLKDLALENDALKAGIKASKEDLSSAESIFAKLNQHYEKGKDMVKYYKGNEECLQKNIDSLQLSLDEQERKNGMLKSRTEDVSMDVKTEVQNVRKSYETRVTVLETQLKKAQMDICSLEHDLQKEKIENDKLGNIYDDLMSKIGV